MKRFAAISLALILGLAATAGQTTSPAPAAPDPVPAPAPQAQTPNADFLRAADEVLAQMSQLLGLPIKQPLKKSLRSKQEIRDYLVREEKEDRTDAQRYADDKALEAFGLIPKGFPLDSFMLDVLTEQVAGLYDPKAKEFYIADWIAADDQREVMSHELTHALEDQSFNVDPWIKAARPNDDAELARDSVSEGTAMAAMVDYALRDDKLTVRDLPDIAPLMRMESLGQMDEDPTLKKAPPFIRDVLLFPYVSGAAFSQQFLKHSAGWPDLKLLFQDPPLSTQQILHPDLYFSGTKPDAITLPPWSGVVPDDWKLLEENVLGEFGVDEILKESLHPEHAQSLAAAWKGDRYAIFEDAKTKNTSIVLLLDLDNAIDATNFVAQYGEALERKYKTDAQPVRRPNFFRFETDSGGVYVRAVGVTVLAVEGASPETYAKITKAVSWPPAPAASPAPEPAPTSPAPHSVTQRMPPTVPAPLPAVP